MNTISAFAALGLRPELLAALERLGYEEPTPIQLQAIPELLTGRDLVGEAATGTGKTAAFALPLLEFVTEGGGRSPKALVLVPTRELAVQVAEAVTAYGQGLGVRVVAVYGGQPIGRQLAALDRGVHVVVATPGRAIDHLSRGSLRLDEVKTVVLDEADEMLDMGFAEDLETILAAAPASRQTVLFSATLAPRLSAIIDRALRDPVRIRISKPAADASGKVLVRQVAYVVDRGNKVRALGRILDVEAPGSAIVFCKTRGEVDELTENLNARGYRAEALHGGMDQPQRDRVMGRLREGTAQLLVATDVAARGLDIDSLTHVVNFDVPSAPESYVHRIGRVGRAGREGVALTLVEPRQRRLLSNIERLTGQRIVRTPVPTVADLRAARIDRMVSDLRAALGADDLDSFYPVLNALKTDADDRLVALAALKLAYEGQPGPGGDPGDEVEIPTADFGRRERPERSPRPERGPRSDARPAGGPTASLYVNLGRKAGVRPGDLVGAIANEAGLSGRQIGPIRVSDHFSVVGVPEASADSVIRAINNTAIRGKQAKVRRYVD